MNSNFVLGVIVPGAVLIFSFLITYMMYRHFSKKQ